MPGRYEIDPVHSTIMFSTRVSRQAFGVIGNVAKRADRC